jgi:DNA-binding CsgD family transcriptional regulator
VLGGICLGSIALHRERASGQFSREEAQYVRRLLVPLACGLRAALAAERPRYEETPAGPGLLILGPDLSRIASTPQADRWLTQLGGAVPGSKRLPVVVYGLVSHLRGLQVMQASTQMSTRTRARLNDGRWLVLHATRLIGQTVSGQIAIVLEPAQPADLAQVLVSGYGLTARERAVAEQVLQGRSTGQIAQALTISRYTVRDHLKAIFAKVGVRTRGELGQALAARTRPLT